MYSGFLDIHFLGGASEVGRSAILLKDSKNILLDYGMMIEGDTEYPINAGRVDACIISHAHLDHSGYSPALFNDALPEIIATEPTMQLAELLIEDSMKIHKRKHQHERYHRTELKTMLNRYVPATYGRRIEFDKYNISLHDAGHICGSAISVIESQKTGKRIAYTGDFKMEPQLLEAGAEVVKSDVLIMEATYAGKDHPNREDLVKKFADEVKETLDNGGVALVPVFAVGRAQEMLAVLNKIGLIGVTFMDGMAKAATDIVSSHPDFIKDSDKLEAAVRKSIWINNKRHKTEAVEGGNVILTTSGMLNGGPVLDYIRRLNRHSKIFLTGYQVENTNGDRLMHGKPLDIDGTEYRVKHPFSVYDFSAHAGKTDLHEYVKKSNPETVICVHGSAENTALLAEDLKLEGFDAHAPKVGDTINVNF